MVYYCTFCRSRLLQLYRIHESDQAQNWSRNGADSDRRLFRRQETYTIALDSWYPRFFILLATNLRNLWKWQKSSKKRDDATLFIRFSLNMIFLTNGTYKRYISGARPSTGEQPLRRKKKHGKINWWLSAIIRCRERSFLFHKGPFFVKQNAAECITSFAWVSIILNAKLTEAHFMAHGIINRWRTNYPIN